MTTISEAYALGRSERRVHKRTPVLTNLARFAGRHLPRWKNVRATVLQVAGLGCLDYAAFQWTPIAGWIVAGVALLVLEWLGGER
jgi:hypothetical protein